MYTRTEQEQQNQVNSVAGLKLHPTVVLSIVVLYFSKKNEKNLPDNGLSHVLEHSDRSVLSMTWVLNHSGMFLRNNHPPGVVSNPTDLASPNWISSLFDRKKKNEKKNKKLLSGRDVAKIGDMSHTDQCKKTNNVQTDNNRQSAQSIDHDWFDVHQPQRNNEHRHYFFCASCAVLYTYALDGRNWLDATDMV